MELKEEIFESSGEGSGGIGGIDNLNQMRNALVYKNADASGAISTESLQPERAFEVFGGKTYLSNSVQATQFSLADTAERRVESPLQRFARLRGELDDLSRDLDGMVKQEINEESSVWSVLQRDARKMIQSLLEVQDHEGFKIHQRKTETITQRFDEVSTKILKDSSAPPLPLPTSAGETGGRVGGRGSGPGDEFSELLSLERRVSALETMLGHASNVLDCEGSLSLAQAAHGGTFPLVDTIVRLERRVALLDPATLEMLRTKSAALRTDLEATQKLKGSSQESQALEAARKVDDLFEQVERVKVVAEEAPALIVRLKTLESIHSSAALFTQRLEQMESSVCALTEELKSNGDVLGSLQVGLAENSKIFADNLRKLDGKK